MSRSEQQNRRTLSCWLWRVIAKLVKNLLLNGVIFLALIGLMLVFLRSSDILTCRNKIYEVGSPSGRWLARTNFRNCPNSSDGPCYTVRVVLIPAELPLRWIALIQAKPVFFIDFLKVSFSEGEDTIKAVWKDDHNLEIIAPGCKNVCYATSVEPWKCQNNYCSIIASYEGINITLVPSKP